MNQNSQVLFSLTSHVGLEFVTDGREAETMSFFTGFDTEDMSMDSVSAILNCKPRHDVVYGRNDEILLLREAFDRSRHGPSEVVFISGCSGSGKSTVAETLRDYCTQQDGYFASGKFDRARQSEPYSALLSALTDVLDLILAGDNLLERRNAINEALGDEAHVLVNLLSNLQAVLGLEHVSDDWYIGLNQTISTFQRVCRTFLRSLATEQHPIVCVIDDIQWSNKSSLDVLSSLLTDPQSHHVLFICIERTDEVVQEASFNDFDEHLKNGPLSMTNMELGNLPDTSIEILVAGLMDTDVSSVKELAALVVEKTAGNPLFAHQFLHNLISEGLLSKQGVKWNFDLTRIKTETTVTENVADLLTKKIGRLDPTTRDILRLAAVMGFTIEMNLLKVVVRAELGNEVADEVQAAIHMAKDERLVEEIATERFRFNHDKVTEALYKNAPKGRERGLLHLRIGRILRDQCVSANKDMGVVFFHASDQLNLGSQYIESQEEILELVRFNIEVGNRAMALRAFSPAARYIGDALDLLDKKDMWSAHYDLTLEAFTTSAEFETNAGNFSKGQAQASAVIANAKSLTDSLKAYTIQIHNLGDLGLLKEALALGLHVLEKMGFGFPKKPKVRHTLIGVVRTTLLLRNRTDEDLLSLPKLEDTHIMCAMKILRSILMWTVFMEEKVIFPLICIKQIQLTLQHGVCIYSTFTFACWGFFQSLFSNRAQAYRFGQLSSRMSEELGTLKVDVVGFIIASVFANHWRQSIHDAIDPLEKSFVSGVQRGEVANGLLAGLCGIHAKFIAGYDLHEAEVEIREICSQMTAYALHTYLPMALLLHQAILNFLGEAQNPIVLIGESCNMYELMSEATSNGNDKVLFDVHFYSLKLACFFQEWKVALNCVMRIRGSKNDALKLNMAHFSCVELVFHSSLAFMAHRKCGGRRLYRREGRQGIVTFHTWLLEGKTDAKAFLLLLQAEELYWSSTTVPVSALEHAFEAAIAACKESRFLHYEAFGYERFSTILMEYEGKVEMVKKHLNRAKELYELWGADCKSRQCQDVLDCL